MSDGSDQVVQLRARLRAQINQEMTWRLRDSTSRQCLTGCVKQFGNHLSHAEKECLLNCADLFKTAFEIVTVSFAEKWRMGEGDMEMFAERNTEDDL
ncbi:MAG: Tim10/DDP family zinc finger protein [archaeon]|nr:Tim10/DDP family zinc finger protein [archaeon]